ncbi:MAG: hypothetical protein FJ213_08965 [Ignavibacteria bacterium]|nr:hypothetical protein [Ignavibacteria bacterium]
MLKKKLNKNCITLILLTILISSGFAIAQDEEEFELYLIDNYVRSNDPSKLVLSWMTNIEALTKVEIPSLGVFAASDTLTDKVFLVIDVSKILNKPGDYDFYFISILLDGREVRSEKFVFTIPQQEVPPIETSRSEISYYFYTCCIGGSFWLMPSVGISYTEGNANFSLNKDIPLLSLSSKSVFKNYPYSFFYVGYNHILKGPVQNLFRYGYRQLFEMKDLLNYISIGLSGFTNFTGVNGISPEISFSFLKILSTFDLYLLYRFDKELINGNYKSHQIQLGLFTSSFSLNINL